MNIEEILDKIVEIKEYEQKLREKRKELEEQLFQSVKKPEDGKPLWIGDSAKIVWSTEAKISQRDAKVWFEKNPDLSKRIFSMTFKPKISEISKLERTLITNPKQVPEWMKDFESLKESISLEEKPKLQFVAKEGKEDE